MKLACQDGRWQPYDNHDCYSDSWHIYPDLTGLELARAYPQWMDHGFTLQTQATRFAMRRPDRHRPWKVPR